jgi:hypothetical protein
LILLATNIVLIWWDLAKLRRALRDARIATADVRLRVDNIERRERQAQTMSIKRFTETKSENNEPHPIYTRHPNGHGNY